MRTLLPILTLLFFASTVRAADAPREAQMSAPADEQPIELGGGVVLPRPVFDEIMRRDDGLDTIDRWEQRASETRVFEGVPHLVVIFGGVLLFFWSAMIYYQRKHARLHRTIQLMVEKGLPVPSEILRAAENAEAGNEGATTVAAVSAAPAWASNLLWGGLLWLTVGITGMAFLWARGSDSWPWGLAAVVYGASAVVTALKKNRVNP
jgi:hypothetical protein